jgi:hypothetical protein
VSSAEMKKANIRVFHDSLHPSQVLLPVVSSTR